MNCPIERGRPYNKFLTPNNLNIFFAALQITPKNFFKSYLQYVFGKIKYEPDKLSCGLNECWYLPAETLRNGVGDCEDMAFLLASLLLTKFNKETICVTIGSYKGHGHAWVEIITKNNTRFVLESTNGTYLEVNDAYQNGYVPEMYIFLDGCIDA